MAGKRRREAELEALLFPAQELTSISTSSAYSIDRQPAPSADPTLASTASTTVADIEAPAAWADDDDNDIEVDLDAVDRLKKLKKGKQSVVKLDEYSNLLGERFQRKEVAWAKQRDTQDDIQSNAASLLAPSSSSKSLPPTTIEMRRLLDGNVAAPSATPISDVSWHSCGDVLAASSMDRHLRLFKLDQEKNSLLLDVEFPNSIHASSFIGPTSEILVCGRKPYFHTYDVTTGMVKKYNGLSIHGNKSHELMAVNAEGSHLAFGGLGGRIHLLNGRLKTETGNVKMNSPVRAMAFYGEHSLVSAGDDADVYVWDVRRTGKCVDRFHNEDGGLVTSIATVQHGTTSYLSIGSVTGVTSLYSMAPSTASMNVSKMREVLNLTTSVTQQRFHPSAQLLALSSNATKDALRFVHLPSCTVFSNWPTAKTPLHVVTAMAFSPRGDVIAVGNKKGRVLMYRCNYFA